MKKQKIKEYVKKSYGKIAQTGEASRPCCGCGCGPSCTDTSLLIGYSKNELSNIPAASNMGLGCGNPTALASLKQGETVLDLGSGGGIDAFLAAKKVGEAGRVIGVDMTKEMIQKARLTAQKNGYKNVEFRLGEIEDLPVDDNSIDVIISNCVINLSPNKKKVFQEAYRVLKPNGRMLISDIVTEGELPEQIQKSISAWAGCVAGAQERKQYLKTIGDSGFKEINIVSESTFTVDISKELKGKITSVQVEAYKTV
ncbi:MAG: arsenite methyltransferase [Candidatus Bathyarchaeota archaeon]|nr:arsenite methyltransferase [Candidatus Bathyarchaeota archaeon]